MSIECDTHPRAALAKLTALLGPPTVVVESGGQWTDPETGETEPKLHIYYRLKTPARSKEEHEKLKLARKLATKLVGGDGSNVSIVHPIRWPGSVHRKGEPKLCHIVDLNPDAEIELDTALEILQKAAGNEGSRDYRASNRPTGPGSRSPKPSSIWIRIRGWPKGSSIEQPLSKKFARRLQSSQMMTATGTTGTSVAWRCSTATGGSDDGLAVFHTWSSKSEKYDEQVTTDRMGGLQNLPAGRDRRWFNILLGKPSSPGWKVLIGLPFEQAMKIAALIGAFDF